MTFYKELATFRCTNGTTVTAYKSREKHSKNPNYEIIISRNGIAIDVIKTARTTWKKAFDKAKNGG